MNKARHAIKTLVFFALAFICGCSSRAVNISSGIPIVEQPDRSDEIMAASLSVTVHERALTYGDWVINIEKNIPYFKEIAVELDTQVLAKLSEQGVTVESNAPHFVENRGRIDEYIRRRFLFQADGIL